MWPVGQRRGLKSGWEVGVGLYWSGGEVSWFWAEYNPPLFGRWTGGGASFKGKGKRTYHKHVGFFVESRRLGVLFVAGENVLVFVGDGVGG